MIPLDRFLNAYIDANLILLVAALIWVAAKALLSLTTLRAAHGAQLQLIYGLIIIAAGVPVLLLLGNPLAVKISDIVVAQYLNGSFAMTPSTFEQILGSRDTLVQDISTLRSPVGQAIAAIALLGFSFVTGRLIIRFLRLRRLIAHSYGWKQFGRLHLRITDATHVPFSSRGLRNHYVLLPASMLSRPHDLRISLAHELQHCRQGDLSWELALEILRCVFFFNPAVHFVKREVAKLRELACDQQVIARKNLQVQDYGACLVRVCRTAMQVDTKSQTTLPVVALLNITKSRKSEQFLRRRVTEMLTHQSRRVSRWVVLALLVPLGVIVTLGAASMQRSGDWSQDRLLLSAIVNLERLDLRNRSN